MTRSTDKQSPCLYSDHELVCKSLDEQGVPQDLLWRSLFLSLQTQLVCNRLSLDQKEQLQKISLRLLQTKDFSNVSLQQALTEQQKTLNAKCIQQLQEALAESEKMLREFRELSMKRSGQVERLESTTITAIQSGQDPNSMITQLRSAFRSIIDMMKRDTLELEHLSKTDQLTGLGNRRAFDHYLQKHIQQDKPYSQICLLLIDIDHFKQFNDKYGHRIGDQALATVAKIIKDHMLEYEAEQGNKYLSVRYGGEEFSVVMPDLEMKDAVQHAEIIRDKVKSYSFVIRDIKGKIIHKEIAITVSIGVAFRDPSWTTSLTEHLIDAADQAMYRAKSSGRDQVCH